MRLPYKQEVTGSSPVFSTICPVSLMDKTTDFYSVFGGSSPSRDAIYAPLVQSAETTGLNPVKCGFESHGEYQLQKQKTFVGNNSISENIPSSEGNGL